ncbi:MAG: putative rane protein [Acidobacteria bacterium]|nr:putative rane protein [Acidobacteriota bacterium]
MLLSQNLLEHGSFKLDQYQSPRPPTVARDDYVEVGTYQLELVNDHVYYFFPPGSSVLSVPYVALLRLFGVRAKDAGGTYGEMRIQTSLAALLMAALALVFFYTARFLLDTLWSSVIALGGVLGTQVWSTASRGLWTHTWELLLIGVIIFLLVNYETRRRKLRPVLLATLLAWAYFVRPTSSITIVAITVYVLLYHRRLFFWYALTLALWLAGFIVYSWHNFGKLLPSYYAATRLNFGVFPTALIGNLVSPSRGLLIYVPWILFTGYLLARYRRDWEFPRLIWLSLACVTGNLIVVSSFKHWWGGVSYGPRLTTDLAPWLVLLTILGVRAMLREPVQRTARRRSELALGALLLALGIFIHGRGATSVSTLRWNDYPKDDAGMEAKIWDWRQPQFLAGLIQKPPPKNHPRLSGETRIDMATTAADKYLWDGWGRPEAGFRWTDGQDANVIFALDEISDLGLKINVAPLIVPGWISEQILQIELNGQAVETVTLNQPEYTELDLDLPKAVLQHQNILTFHLPHATSPAALKLSIDQRQLGLAIKWIEFSPPK